MGLSPSCFALLCLLLSLICFSESGIPLKKVKYNSEDELVFLQAVWRHGDRSPIVIVPTDPYTEDTWFQGLGELSLTGMKQHEYLGRARLGKRYIDDLKFLSPFYNAHEVHIRSTDIDRTLQSAMSNVAGMFSSRSKRGHDYPNSTYWPQGYVPVPVHTINFDHDHELNPDTPCARQSQIVDLLHRTPEYKAGVSKFQPLFDYVSKFTGTPINFTNIWALKDSVCTYNRTWPKWTKQPWHEKPVFHAINASDNFYYALTNGLNVAPFQGINFTNEIPKLRGGSLLWSQIDLMQQKVKCLQAIEKNKNRVKNQYKQNAIDESCKWISKLKYYAYSGHDVTLTALFTTLGFKRPNINENGYPHYSSCAATELWKRKGGDGEYYVRVVYYPLGEPTEDVTDEITGCSSPCKLEDFIQRSRSYKAEPNIKEWCNAPLNIDVAAV